MRSSAGMVLRIIALTVFEALIIMAVYRTVLVTLLLRDIVGAGAGNILLAFLYGLRSDIVVLCSLLLIPYLLSILSAIGEKVQHVVRWIDRIYVLVVVPLFLLILAADVPFFAHYNTHISVHALHWTSSPRFMLGLVFSDMLHMFLLAAMVALSIFWCTRLLKRLDHCRAPLSRRGAFILCWLLPLFVVGIRGRTTSRSAMQIGTTFFSGHHLVDQLTLNPAHVLALSWGDRSVHALRGRFEMDQQLASDLIRGNLNTQFRYLNDLGVVRNVTTHGSRNPYNVVVILGESLSANKCGALNIHRDLTPVLDSLAQHGLFFKQCYSDGIHTFNGIYATITGHPSPPGVQTLRSSAFLHPSFSLPNELQRFGYSTHFFTTHDEEFDNMAGFLKANGMENIIGAKDFSSKEELSITGVPDHVLFEKAVDEFGGVKPPFFACILTGSDHGPWVIPENFPEKSDDIKENATRYADWSLGHFLRRMQQAGFHENTLYVITGDHGAILENDEDMYLAMHHVPLLFLVPNTAQTSSEHQELSGQIDIAPTVLGLLNIKYVNSSFGIDLMLEQRTSLPASYDDEMITFMDGTFCVDRTNAPHCFTVNEEKTFCPPMDIPNPDPREVTKATMSLVLDGAATP